MTEYWVSKKQYWCKYCNIFIRDDAPSRRLHETGLKHLGSKERYIRDLYKNGDMVKREKAAEAAEMARIEASAAAAYAHDALSGAPASRPSVLQRIAASSAASTSKLRDTKPKDKWANYSTAEQLGFDDEDTQKSMYEIEQELKGRAGEIGKWEEVTVEPSGLYSGENDQAGPSSAALGGKRKWEDEDDNFKFAHDKRVVHDPYDDDWDPSTLKSLKVRVKEESKFGSDSDSAVQRQVEGGLNREKWTGKLELKPAGLREDKSKEGMRYDESVGGWVKRELAAVSGAETTDGIEDVKPPLGTEDVKPALPAEEDRDGGMANGPNSKGDPPINPSLGEIKPGIGVEASAESAGGSSMFKKRRPPPSSRKK